jgi:hypothetical protein
MPHEGISKSFQGFIAMRKDGALMGPWNPWLHEARIGKPIWDLTKALSVRHDPARFEIAAETRRSPAGGKSCSGPPTRTPGNRTPDNGILPGATVTELIDVA